MAGLVRNRIGAGSVAVSSPNSQDYSASVYAGAYPEMEPPATSYATSRSPLASGNPPEDYRTDLGVPASLRPAIVNRHERRDGQLYNYAIGQAQDVLPQMPQAVFSSHFQQMTNTLHPWMINDKWYIAYPGATVMNGGMHNLGISEKTPQIDTRISGGPGPTNTIMNSRPRFNRVQRIPRYPTGPSAYNTRSASS